MQDYRKLKVWQKAHQMVLEIYKITRGFPNAELYGLVSQLRRSAISVPSNIVEGSARRGDAEFLRFLLIAYGSCSEVEYQIFLSKDLGYLSEQQFEGMNPGIVEVKRMLNGLMDSIRDT